MKRFIFVLLFVLSIVIGITCLLTSPPINSTTSGASSLQETHEQALWINSSSPLFPTLSTSPVLPKVSVTPVVPPVPPVPTTTVPTVVIAAPSTTSPVVVTTLPPPAPPVTTVTEPTSSVTSPGDYDHRWDRVAVCEESGWGNYGFPAYPNSLGINSASWYQFGGGSDLSPAAQVAVAERFAAHYVYAGYVPDENGCAAW